MATPRPIFLAAERLVQIWVENERLLAERRSLRMREAQARAYLASDGVVRRLGEVRLEQLAGRRVQILARLRSNHEEVVARMAELEAERALMASMSHARCQSA